MAYTFGGGTGDDIAWSNNTIILGSNGSTQLIAGWWYPTTLTATRGLWSAGNVNGAEIDSTTDELRLRIDATTDGQWTTTGVDLTTDQWYFLAFLNTNNNTGAASAWRVWRGTIDAPPVECTVAVAVARSGNSTGNNTYYIGNKGTGTVAFQGDIAEVVVVTTGNTGATLNPFSLATAGTITNVEAEFVYNRMVLPLWAGQGIPDQQWAIGTQTAFSYWSGLAGDSVKRTAGSAVNNNGSTTPSALNGATVSQQHAPRTLGLRAGDLPLVRR